MYSEALGFLIIVIFMQIGVTLFVWIVNLLNAVFVYPQYIANASEHAVFALKSLGNLFKECIAFICMIAVMRNTQNTGFAFLIAAGLVMTAISIHGNFHCGLKTMIHLHVARVFIQNNYPDAK